MLVLVTRVILVLLILLGVRLLVRVLAPLFVPRGARSETRARRPARAVQRGEMVRDSMCGTWVDRRIALTASRDGETAHFCSTACRDRYLAGPSS